MANVHDVAAYILEQRGAMSAMKLQKLVYYSQAWHLVWEERPLFDDAIEAWANGPVVRELYRGHRGRYVVDEWSQGNAAALVDDERSSIDAVLDFYGDRGAHWLSELTHREAPWREARREAGLGSGERGSVEISQAAMAEYYDGLTTDGS